jgi:hypothetical protein
MTFVNVLLLGWVVVFLVFASWVAQYFYNEYKNKNK